MDKKARAKEILKRLRKEFPKPGTALKHENPFELLIATILSAQSTDVQVNKITPGLFAKYKGPKGFASASLGEIKKDASSVNFFNNKAKNIKACAEMIVRDFGGRVPDTMEDLIKLPGVARKTANIVLSSGMGIIEGIAVDTHVKRLAGLLGLTENTDPVKIEKDLIGLFPKKDWPDVSNLLIFHGRKTCKARNPNHAECALRDICPSARK